MERRRTTPRAYFRDSTTLGKFEGLSQVFGDMPMVTYRTPPGGGIAVLMNSAVRGVRSIGGGSAPTCWAAVWVYGQKADGNDLTASLRPKDIAGIEVYLNNQTTPVQYGGG